MFADEDMRKHEIGNGRDWVSQTEGLRRMREFAEMFYNSPAWKETRKAYARSKAGLCERCLAQGIYKPGVIVHHKRHLSPDNINDPNITLSWSNLELLCRDCHGEQHRTVPRRYRVDDMGRITER